MPDPWIILALVMSAAALAIELHARLRPPAGALTADHATHLADALKLNAAATMQATSTAQIAAQRLRIDAAAATALPDVPPPAPPAPEPGWDLATVTTLGSGYASASASRLEALESAVARLAVPAVESHSLLVLNGVPAAQVMPMAEPAPTVPAAVGS